MKREPTQEQQEIIASAGSITDSLQINAYAGTGKSTTLEMLAPKIRASRPAAFAFNKSIAMELKPRFPENYTVKTLNALGHAAICRTLGSVELDNRKLSQLARGMKLERDEAEDVCELVSLAMMKGIVPNEFQIQGLAEDEQLEWAALGSLPPTNEGIAAAREMLSLSIKEALRGKITFDDQIYLSTMFGMPYPQYDLVLVDEAQDLSPLNHVQIKKTIGLSGRLIVVGDVRQAIYAWRGADSKSMANIKRLRPMWQDLALTTTFRCPKRIVERQLEHAPGFNALPGAPDGAFISWEDWCWTYVKEGMAESRLESVAILCRNNAPLISLALKLLAQRIPARVLGRDIGAQLQKLAKRITGKQNIGRDLLLRKIGEWKETQLSLSEANEDGRAAGIADRGDSLLAVASEVRDSDELQQVLRDIFAEDSPGVLLSSIHKSKGREWDCVVHLNPELCPSPWAKSAGAKEQERNLKYVCETRTKHTLIEARLRDFS